MFAVLKWLKSSGIHDKPSKGYLKTLLKSKAWHTKSFNSYKGLIKWRQILKEGSNESRKLVNTSIMERVKSELAGLFSIRRVGGAGNLHPLSMAEAAVERGDFGGAVDYLKLLSDREIDFDSRRSWIKDVRIFLKAQQHLVKLRWHVSSKLGAEAQAD